MLAPNLLGLAKAKEKRELVGSCANEDTSAGVPLWFPKPRAGHLLSVFCDQMLVSPTENPAKDLAPYNVSAGGHISEVGTYEKSAAGCGLGAEGLYASIPGGAGKKLKSVEDDTTVSDSESVG